MITLHAGGGAARGYISDAAAAQDYGLTDAEIKEVKDAVRKGEAV